MKVLVFTMAYNAEKTLSRAMDSVLNQTFRNLRYIVLDNGSSDRTWDIIRAYAARDSRVFPLSIRKNNPANGSLMIQAISCTADTGYFVWLDADDSYSPDFLEKMLPFAEENRLDIASCGYDMIDGASGRLLRRRVAPEHILLSGTAFAERFVDYRSFTMVLWGKVYSIPFLQRVLKKGLFRGDFRMYSDAAGVQKLFRMSERAGIYGESLHQYYQYPRSTSHLNLRENIACYRDYYFSIRDFLEHYGPISRRNEDFLYAVYLSLVDEGVEHIFAASMSVAEKLELLRLTFQEPLWAETLARKANPEFRNLAGRAEYVARTRERIRTLAVTPEEDALAEAAIRALEGPARLSSCGPQL